MRGKYARWLMRTKFHHFNQFWKPESGAVKQNQEIVSEKLFDELKRIKTDINQSLISHHFLVKS